MAKTSISQKNLWKIFINFDIAFATIEKPTADTSQSKPTLLRKLKLKLECWSCNLND